ncbi:MAG: gamma-glutamylcyclotransferase [Methylococcaceae bacterium]|nr:gamma-glutamylcyclotransferase [Methylococcaceae bacterium]
MRDLNYLFVYGTLKRTSNSQEHHFLARHADFIDTARYYGKLYQIDYYPGVIPSDNPDDSVDGEVYVLRDADAVLSYLDRYEECSPEFPEPHEYCRKQQTVCLNNGTALSAWIYLYYQTTVGLQRLSIQF